MNPAGFTIKNNRTSLVIYTLIMLIGVQTYFKIGRLEYPEFTIRNAMVITPYTGRTTVQVEQEVTEPLEQTLRQMPEVDKVKSTSKPGISIINVEVKEEYFDMEDIWTDLRNRVEAVRLPDGASRPIVDDDFGEQFPYLYALKSDGFSKREMKDAAEDIRDKLLEQNGVAKVEFHGDQDERIYLEFSSNELAARGLTLDGVIAALSSQNTVAASGEVSSGPERLDLITLGEFKSVEELEEYRLSAPGQSTSLRISDVFDVSREYVDPPQSLSHYNGEQVICISVSMVEGRAVTEVGERVSEAIEEIQNKLPIGLDIEVMFFQPQYVEKSIYDFVANLGQAFFFVVLVMLLFAGWRIAMIVGVLVPSAVLMCFTLMPFFDIQLEMMSIAALIIALGLLVDNAVVVSEQILVRFSEGEERKGAVIETVKGLMIPLLAASGTTIAAFSAIGLATGSVAEFTFSLFAVVSLTLLSSWLLSITVIPLFCYWFLKPLKKDTLVGRGLNRVYQPYESLLRFSLRLKWGYPVLIYVLTLVAAVGMRFVPNIFFPPNERGQFVVDFELPLGTDILETELQVNKLEDWFARENPEMVKSVSAWIGDGGPRWYLSLSPEPANPNYSFLSVITHASDPKEIAYFVEKVNRYTETNFPSARVLAKPLENGPPVGDPIQIRLYGEDMAVLYELRDKVVNVVNQVPGMVDVRDDWGAWIKQVTVDPDPVRSTRLGLNTSSIASALNLQFAGQQVTTLREGEEAIPIVLRSEADYRKRPERLPDLPIFGQTGVFPLSQVASTKIDFLPGSILREDTLRVMTIKGKVRGRFSSQALADIQPLLSELTSRGDWPVGYHIEYGGEQEESAEAQQKLAGGMPIAMSMLVLILIAQFNSMRCFAIIILTIPPMLCGVVPGLLLTGSSFGFMTMLGLLALLGIIVNNAILLIDETNLQLRQGKDLVEGIVDASKSRLRPIVMTTVTTIIGLAPLAISGGGMWSSMAWAMMFGLGFATLLTLILCPVLFYLFFKPREKRSKQPRKLKKTSTKKGKTGK
ncbi:MAG: efflux RND transporter permease subunit [Verrucomicrobiales bacterium]|nr:efflux RND transporter permease subunit [Verrucomicrobiales bacterium]